MKTLSEWCSNVDPVCEQQQCSGDAVCTVLVIPPRVPQFPDGDRDGAPSVPVGAVPVPGAAAATRLHPGRGDAAGGRRPDGRRGRPLDAQREAARPPGQGQGESRGSAPDSGTAVLRRRRLWCGEFAAAGCVRRPARLGGGSGLQLMCSGVSASSRQTAQGAAGHSGLSGQCPSRPGTG